MMLALIGFCYTGRMKKLSFIAALLLLGCADVKSQESARVEIITAPDGARCYAIVQGAEVKGGSCTAR